jgi:uncharacterized repeat protein (TIGR03803 family)
VGDTVYGVGYQGGTGGRGTIYKVAISWSPYGGTVTKLHDFADGSVANDGQYAVSSMVRDGSGNLYGIAKSGGTSGYGIVFKYSSGGTYSIIHHFSGGTSDGCGPAGGLTIDNAGSLYGTTSGCGSSANGVIFKMTVSGGVWSETILHHFAGGSGGYSPSATMILASDGKLYGTAAGGGTNNTGTVFQVSPSTGTFANIYSFATGQSPSWNGLAELPGATSFTLYGTTPYGGTSNLGTLYKLTKSGSSFLYSLVHSFAGGSDGSLPWGNMIYSSVIGSFYGITYTGGSTNKGTFFGYAPSWGYGVLNSLSGYADNVIWGPVSCQPCVLGASQLGGTNSVGSVWSLIAP